MEIARESVEDANPSAPSPRDLLLFCHGFCTALNGHHRREDTSLLPRIVEAYPDLAPVIAQLTQDHHMIEHLIGDLERTLDAGAPKAETLRHLDGIDALDVDLDETTALGPLA
jgi:hypothetical protein